eukprot:2968545-Amphidinium_carterae.1
MARRPTIEGVIDRCGFGALPKMQQMRQSRQCAITSLYVPPDPCSLYMLHARQILSTRQWREVCSISQGYG